MLIGVLSDTHDRLPMINATLGVFAQRRVEALIHLGECCGWVNGQSTVAVLLRPFSSSWAMTRSLSSPITSTALSFSARAS